MPLPASTHISGATINASHTKARSASVTNMVCFAVSLIELLSDALTFSQSTTVQKRFMYSSLPHTPYPAPTHACSWTETQRSGKSSPVFVGSGDVGGLTMGGSGMRLCVELLRAGVCGFNGGGVFVVPDVGDEDCGGCEEDEGNGGAADCSAAPVGFGGNRMVCSPRMVCHSL